MSFHGCKPLLLFVPSWMCVKHSEITITRWFLIEL